MKTIVPRPLFAEASSMVLQQEDYFLLQPSVCQYLNEFPLGLNAKRDFEWARFFLAQHTLSPGTYASYRGLVERLLLWSWISCGKSIFDLDRDDFEDFLSFNLSPPPDWIGDAVRRRFLKKEEAWVFNDYWRPFYARAYWCQWPLILTHFWPIKLTHLRTANRQFSASVDSSHLPA